MSTAPQFDSISWFSQFSPEGEQIDPSDLQPVLEFTLIWNLFEKETCRGFVQINRLREHVDRAVMDDRLDIATFQPHLDFFRGRYPDHNEEDFLADHLLSSQRRHVRTDLDYIRLLSDVLSGVSTDTNNVVFALLFIAYRVRNNLFHGEKNVYTLHLQRDLFQMVNSCLSTYLDQTCRQLRG